MRGDVAMNETELLRKSRWIASNPEKRGLLSTGQLIAMAVVLNQPDWLAEMGYTRATALNRLEPGEVALAEHVAYTLRYEAKF